MSGLAMRGYGLEFEHVNGVQRQLPVHPTSTTQTNHG